FLLLASVGAAWVAWREAAHGREVTRLREQLLLEEERRRLAREIHDGVGHILAAGTQSLALVERLLPGDPQRAGTLLPGIKQLLRQGLDEIRCWSLVSGRRGPRRGTRWPRRGSIWPCFQRARRLARRSKVVSLRSRFRPPRSS